MNEGPQPTKGEFIAYWQRHEKERSSWRGLLPYMIYIGCLAVYALAVRRLDTHGRFWIASIVIAIAYVIGLP